MIVAADRLWIEQVDSAFFASGDHQLPPFVVEDFTNAIETFGEFKRRRPLDSG